MDLIPSFSVDHTKIIPGIFTSRVDVLGEEKVTTYDVRVTKPNVEPAVDVAAMHTLEHLVASAICSSGPSAPSRTRRTFPAPRRKTAAPTACTIWRWPNGTPANSRTISPQTRKTPRFSNIPDPSGWSRRTAGSSSIPDPG